MEALFLTFVGHHFQVLLYPLVNSQKTMENHHCSCVNPLFLWSFSIANCNKLLEGNIGIPVGRFINMDPTLLQLSEMRDAMVDMALVCFPQ